MTPVTPETMHADFPVVLDTCVLANYAVCDLVLRLAEPPRLYLPRLFQQILAIMGVTSAPEDSPS